MEQQPIHSNPLSEKEKELIFSDSYGKTTADDYLRAYIASFLRENSLTKCTIPSILRRRLLISLVYSLILFLMIVYFCLYHDHLGFLGIVCAILTVIYRFLLRRANISYYLFKEIKLRPQDPIDNILASQVSGVRGSSFVILSSIAMPLMVLVIAALLFAQPHFIYEQTSSSEFSVRYYTYSLIPQDAIIVPETHKGLPVTEIRGSTFLNMRLRQIQLPSSLTEIRGNTFEGCTRLRSITIPQGVTRIGGHAFSGCSSLQSVELPAGLEEIGGSAFRECWSLDHISLENTVLVRIGTSAFRDCHSLKAIQLPPTVRSLGDSVFRDCRRLKSVSLPAGASLGNKVFQGTDAKIDKY